MSSSNEHNLIPLETVCVISERWPVMPFDGQFPDPRFPTVVFYRVGFRHRQYSIESEHNLSVITFKHHFKYKGSPKQFQEWGRRKGGPEIARHIIKLVNGLIDIVQATFEESDDNPFPHIRRVGIRDFVSMDTLYGDKRQNLISYFQPAMHSTTAARSIGAVSRVSFTTLEELPKKKIKIIRAVELLNSGYHTEAMLMSFSLLDYSLQDLFIEILEDRGVECPEAFLKSIPSKRMKTYLGPLLKALTGHSLEEDDPQLWDKLKTFNVNRNNAMHKAFDMPYEQAKEAIETTRDILLYLKSIPSARLEQLMDSSITPDLNIDRLPFMLEERETS